jgi:UDP-galactopyranose mutase
VIDERLDLGLVDAVSKARPDWQFVFVGPVTKIDPGSLPHAPNIHYLGGRTYDELPSYLSGWDVALLPFAHNESTRFISPHQDAGIPGGRSARRCRRQSGTSCACSATKAWSRSPDGPRAFMEAIEKCLGPDDPQRQSRVDRYLALQSWDRTWARMQALMSRSLSAGAARGLVRPSYHGVVTPVTSVATVQAQSS